MTKKSPFVAQVYALASATLFEVSGESAPSPSSALRRHHAKAVAQRRRHRKCHTAGNAAPQQVRDAARGKANDHEDIRHADGIGRNVAHGRNKASDRTANGHARQAPAIFKAATVQRRLAYAAKNTRD